MISIGPASAMAAAFDASASMLSTWALISMFRAMGRRTTELLGVRCPRTWPLHCDFRLGEAELLIECSNTRWCCPQNPSDSPVVAHGRFDQGAAYALSPMRLGHDEHRDVAIRDTVAKSAQEAQYFATLDGHKRQVRPQEKLSELLCVGNPALPTAGHKQASGRFDLRRLNGTNLHLKANVRHERRLPACPRLSARG